MFLPANTTRDAFLFASGHRKERAEFDQTQTFLPEISQNTTEKSCWSKSQKDSVKGVDHLLPTSSVESAWMLAETREALRQFETSALSDVACALSVISESFARTTQEIASVRWEEWLDPEGARLHLKRTKSSSSGLHQACPATT